MADEVVSVMIIVAPKETGLSPRQLVSGSGSEGDFFTGLRPTIDRTRYGERSGGIRSEFHRGATGRASLRSCSAQRSASRRPGDSCSGHARAVTGIFQGKGNRIGTVSSCGGFIR